MTDRECFTEILRLIHDGDCYYFRDQEIAVVERFDTQLAVMLRAHKASEEAIDAYYESRMERGQ